MTIDESTINESFKNFIYAFTIICPRLCPRSYFLTSTKSNIINLKQLYIYLSPKRLIRLQQNCTDMQRGLSERIQATCCLCELFTTIEFVITNGKRNLFNIFEFFQRVIFYFTEIKLPTMQNEQKHTYIILLQYY